MIIKNIVILQEKNILVNFKKLTIDCVLSTIAKKYSKKNAIIFKDKKITYKELYENSTNYADNLLNLGIKKGDKVALLLSNRLEYIYLYFALFKIGAWVVPITIKCEPFQLKNILKKHLVNKYRRNNKKGWCDYLRISIGISTKCSKFSCQKQDYQRTLLGSGDN